MSKFHIISVGFTIPFSDYDYLRFSDQKSLSDADIVVLSPAINEFNNNEYFIGSTCFQGLDSLSNNQSFNLKRDTKFWQREVIEYLNSGKTIFMVMDKPQGLYVATGEKRTSGTGRNQKVINIVDSYKQFQVIPDEVGSLRSSSGNKIILDDKKSIYRSFFEKFKGFMDYEVILEDFPGEKVFLQNTTKKCLGGHLKVGSGNLVILPRVYFDEEEFTTYEGVNERWSDDGEKLSKIFIKELIGIHKTLIGEEDQGSIPEWLSKSQFSLSTIEKTEDKISVINKKIEELQEEKELHMAELHQLRLPQLLLYGKGKLLEEAVRTSLRSMEFDVTNYDNGDSEFDIVIESSEGRAIGEVEGRDNKQIAVKKYSQLLRNIGEDFERDEVEVMAKGVLFGNAFRITTPEERGIQFTEKCLSGAKSKDIALINTSDLFLIYQYLSNKKDKAFAAKCRKAILNGKGLVSFPNIPNKKK
ncbi:conserved hypothetical protein [Halobacteriovorax marinus SJ]|uniref:Uncharacterized protein n=1 Tax=Halobacteriovorax marinus (strain ATCC BAA-682 / DSM 15412 / SJ) TaxID=862908 RepID=E1WXX8_HALMS|nr:hypothetical protein [Halobacteriovorax marinus]CBW25935.1 conserved hypothetical protein [Halobacteriovorax marinus SJ]